MANHNNRHIADSELIAFLPMVYLAWADGELSSDEIQAICSKLAAARGPEADCKSRLGSWLDPEQPPTVTELQTLLATIRRHAAGLAPAEKISLSRLGIGLARLKGSVLSAAEEAALEEIETAIGISGDEATRLLLVPLRPSEESVEYAADFEIATMTRLLDGEHAAVRARVREILTRPEFAYEYDLNRAAYREKTLRLCRVLAAEGIGALSFPKTQGGSDDMSAFVAAFETLAFGDLSLVIKFGVQFGLFGGSILQLGSEDHHAKYLARVGSLDLPGCFAMTETGHGSNVYDVETVAHYDRATDEFVIHTPHDGARKDYIGNAALHGQMATVFAQLSIGEAAHGVHAFLVPIRHPNGGTADGIKIEDCGEKMGLNGIDNGRIWFDHVRIPRTNLLDRFAQVDSEGTYTSAILSPSKRFFTMLGTLVGGRVSVALAALSAGKSALAIAVRYGAGRRQFGPVGERERVILDYRTHQLRLMPRLATTYALDFALKHLALAYTAATEENRREVEGLAAGLKAFATWHATDTIQTCREACGGQGYLAENRFAALKADTDIFTTFEGDNTVLMQLLAKGLLTGYKRQFSEMNWLGMVRHFAEGAAARVAEQNPVITRKTDTDHLLDREFHFGALEWRQDHLMSTLARRLKSRLDRGLDSFEALIEVQDHALALAQAHTEFIILEQFSAAIEICEDPALVTVLTQLCNLYALHRIHLDRGWFLEQGYLESNKSKAIRKLINRLCAEVREQAIPLVDAFGIPEACLGAPIARPSYLSVLNS